MKYLVDSNCFIQAKNEFYGFDFCPGFWQWVDEQHTLNVIYSIKAVGDELKHGSDELATWAKQKDSSFFLPPDTLTGSSLRPVVTWVNSAGSKPHMIPLANSR